MQYDKGKQTIYHHRYNLVWITKYRYKVLTGAVREGARDCAAGLRGNWRHDHQRSFVHGPRPHVRLDPTPPISERCDAARQGAHLAKDPDGVPRTEKKILGPSFLSTGLFLHHKRGGEWGHHTSVHREAFTQFYRRQPVVV